MTIGDLERCTGMTRANIRYYEQEGLLSPVRRENGYRDYSQEDLDTLLRIKLLRQLDFSLEEIRKLQRGELDFSAAMARRSDQLARDRDQLDIARQVCRDLGREVRSFQELHAETYLGRLSGISPLVPAQQRDEREIHPWRRYFARGMDVSLAVLTIYIIQSVILHTPILDGAAAMIGRTLLAWGVILLVEPLLIHFWGTTPGKWVWGIRLERNGGGRLTLGEAYKRTFYVFAAGEGMSIPIVEIICNFRSYRRYKQGYDLYWEEDSVLRFQERGWLSLVLYVGGYILLSACSVLLALNTFLPPNHNDLTVANFAENYNYYNEALELSDISLDQDGNFFRVEDPFRVAIFAPPADPEFAYEVTDGALRAVSYTLEVENQQEMFAMPAAYAKTAYLAMAAARPGTTVFNIANLLSTTDAWTSTASCSLCWQDVSMTYIVDASGYDPNWLDAGYFLPIEGWPNHLTITFRAEMVE